MADIQTNEPTEIIKGTTVKWYKTLPDHPASEWTLKYSIRGPSTLDITCTAENDSFLAEISSTETAALTAGKHWFQAYAEKDGERYLAEWGTITVKADLAEADAGYDGRTYAETVLEAIEDMLKGKASQDQREITIGDKSLSRMTPSEIEQWRNVYKAEVLNQKRAERIRRGGYSGKTIYTRFL